MKLWSELQDISTPIYRRCNIFLLLSLPSGQWFFGNAHENTGHPFTGFPDLFVRSCDAYLQLGFGKLWAENVFIKRTELFIWQNSLMCRFVFPIFWFPFKKNVETDTYPFIKHFEAAVCDISKQNIVLPTWLIVSNSLLSMDFYQLTFETKKPKKQILASYIVCY